MMSDTPPYTPLECDLRDYPWMPVDCTRLLTSETWLLGTAEQKIAAFTLWAKSWHQVPAGSLPDNDRMLSALSEVGSGWKRIRDHALRGWIKCSDGRLYHPVVCEKANEAWRIKLAQRARTEAARQAKAARRAANATDAPAPPVATPVTDPVTSDVTTSTRPDQNKKEEREETSLTLPREADAVSVDTTTPAVPEWPPPPVPSSVTARVEEVVIRLKGKARGQPFLTPRGPVRTVDEQVAAVASKRQPKPLAPDVLATLRQQARGMRE